MDRVNGNAKWVWVGLLGVAVLLAICACRGMPSRQVAQPQQPLDLITIPAVNITSQNGAVHVAVISSQPFTYNISNDDKPPRIVIDIQKARFVDLPPQITVEQGGVTHVTLSQEGGKDGAASLQIHLTQKVTYNVTKDRHRLLIDISPPAETSIPSAFTAPTGAALPTPAASDQVYRIGAKDILDITVYREPDLSGKFSVNPDGFITFPLIGQVQAQGHTTAELSDAMQRLLAQGYLVRPQISVEVAAYQSQQVLALGAVQNPGHFYLGGKTTLLEMLSRAGGLAHDDGRSHVLILFRQRTPQGSVESDAEEGVQTMHIDLERLLDQGDMSLNIPLQGQDVIYVPKPASILVFGEVKTPGPVPLSGNSMTLIEAISKAGGFTRIAAPSRTKVIRMVDGVERARRVNVADIIKRGDRSKDIVLEANDIVVVPESVF